MWSRTPASTDSLSRRVIKQCNHHCDAIIIAMPRRHLAGKAEGWDSSLLFVDRGLRIRCPWVGLPVQAVRSLADWTGCAGCAGCWIGGMVSRASACSLAALDQLPAAERCKLVGKKWNGGSGFFLLLGVELPPSSHVSSGHRCPGQHSSSAYATFLTA